MSDAWLIAAASRPNVIVAIFHADMGKSLLYGTILTIPTASLPVRCIRNFCAISTSRCRNVCTIRKNSPSWKCRAFTVSVWTSLVPVVLMVLRAITEMLLPTGNPILAYTEFFYNPIIATLIVVLITTFTFSFNRGRSMDNVMGTITDSIKIIAMMLLIIGVGAFKQELVDSSVDKYIASLMECSTISPLLLAWTIVATLRIALGSVTVAAITTGGIEATLIATTGKSRADGHRRWLRQRDLFPCQRSQLLAVQGVFQLDNW